jgi:aryl-alcohol dehydrogenase-like predicted oxidoreductase
MQKIHLGSLEISKICLGTMTWGQQNTQDEGFSQMDLAIDLGVNFWDTAEMYPVPPMEATYTATETIIGNWFQKSGKRDQVVLATKVIGHSAGHPWVRNGIHNGLRRESIFAACDASLKRLKTDHIDLYQFHWPDRSANFFGKLGFDGPQHEYWTPLEESMGAAADLIRAGKIRHFGVSNETAWGLMKYLWLAKELGLPAPVSLQNPYSLINRSAEVALAEVCFREDVGFLAYSPMGFGRLSGKYEEGSALPSSRLNLFGTHFKRYSSPQAILATGEYAALARAHGMSPAQMALAFVNSRVFIRSTIIGATQLGQLRENIASLDVVLSAEVLAGIDAIHQRHSNPAP